MPTFYISIRSIVPFGPQPQVGEAGTRRIVTVVKHAHPVGYRADDSLPHRPVDF